MAVPPSIVELVDEHVPGAAELLAARHRSQRVVEPGLDPVYEDPAATRREIEALRARDGGSGTAAIGGDRGYELGRDPSSPTRRDRRARAARSRTAAAPGALAGLHPAADPVPRGGACGLGEGLRRPALRDVRGRARRRGGRPGGRLCDRPLVDAHEPGAPT